MTNDISNYNDLGLALSYDRTVADLCGGDITKYLTIIKKLLKLISFSRNDQVIELGAGTGLASELILEHNFSRLYLLDRSRMVLEVAEQRLTRYDPQWEFLANKHFQNQESGNLYSEYNPLINIPRVRFLLQDAVSIDHPLTRYLGKQQVEKVLMLNAWVSVQEKETLLKAVYNRLKPNGIFAFNTKLNSSVDSIREIATRITGKMDYTDIVPESGREDIEELVSSRFQINAYGEEDLYLTRSEAERYLEEAVIRTKSFGNSWRKRPELKEDNFFWRKEGYFVLEKV